MTPLATPRRNFNVEEAQPWHLFKPTQKKVSMFAGSLPASGGKCGEKMCLLALHTYLHSVTGDEEVPTLCVI